MIYVVVQRGVYIRGVWGPYDTVANASRAAELKAAMELDDYHDFEVCSLNREVTGLSEPVATFHGPRPATRSARER